jgi:hypothetical protein
MNSDSTDRKIERERSHFKRLIAANPDHFGPRKLMAAGVAMAATEFNGNTAYETIGCVGYNPTLGLLEATVQIKRAFGYGGDLCDRGSTEFIRFYVDLGSGWVDAGLASFNAHDIADGHDCAKQSVKPLSYAVSLPYAPARKPCYRPQLPRVRAILSWEWQPPANQPGWHPVWGTVVDRHIQIAAGRLRLYELLKDAAVKLPFDISHLALTEIDVPHPPVLDTLQLATLYAHGGTAAKAEGAKAEVAKVDAHRFGFAEAQAQMSASVVGDSSALSTKLSQYKAAGIDWSAVFDTIADPKGDVSYEELRCVALDYNREWAVANFVMKRGNGYSGGPCTAGSQEHIAFWIDWDDVCDWTYLGTVTQTVHDYAAMPADGLHYWVGIPARIAEHRRSCKEPKLGRLRAVLSWNAAPSTTDPDAVPYWGNRLDTHIEIKPGVPVGDLPLIDTLGGVSLTYISTASTGMTVPNGLFAETGAPTDPWLPSRTCAFGGTVSATAEVPSSFAASGFQYRLMVRPEGGAPGYPQPVVGSFAVTRTLALGGGTTSVTPGAGGWTPYLDPNLNIYSNLGVWSTTGLSAAERNARWEIRLERRDGGAVLNGHTPWYKLQLDNDPPVAALQIDSGGVVQDCNDFNQGTDVTGHFLAYDPQGHFGAWSLDTTPNSLSPPDPVADPALDYRLPTTTVGPGHGWRLTPTAGLQPCGYVVTVWAYDNTIVDSNPWTHNWASDDTGFCLRKFP